MKQIAVLVLAAACAVVSGQTLPSCRELRQGAQRDGVVLFRRVNERIENACPQNCVGGNGRVRAFYSCCPGFEAFVPSGADQGATVVVDASTEVVLCQAPPTGSGGTDLAPTPGPTEIPRCPSSGPTSLNEFEYNAIQNELVCQSTCQFGTSVFGIPTGTKTRTIYHCCEGEAYPIRYRQYGCPSR